jgi:hypothetical protein
MMNMKYFNVRTAKGVLLVVVSAASIEEARLMAERYEVVFGIVTVEESK